LNPIQFAHRIRFSLISDRDGGQHRTMRKSLIKRGSPVRHFIIHGGSIRPKTDIHELVFSRVRVEMAQNAIKYVHILQGISSLLIQHSNVIDFADWLGWQITRG
jgi:hypothetical protein